MKTVVVYSSKYGSTAKYAALIANDLGADLKKASDMRPSMLSEYEGVVFGGGLYAGGIRGADFIRKNAALLKGKRVAVFTVGMSDPGNKKYCQQVIDRNFDAGVRISCRFFSLRGGIEPRALTPVHRLMIGALKAALGAGRGKEKNREMLAVLAGADFFDRTSIAPITEYMKAR